MSPMKKKVLVVDDEPEVRRLIRRVLQKMDHAAIEAEDGAGVMQLIRHERPDLVLLDIHMPGLDGIAALSEILDIDPVLPVVMVTGDSDRVMLALERGASEYITKPFDLRSLETSITGHLERRSVLQNQKMRLEGDGMMADVRSAGSKAAHDLNNMLTALMGFTEMALLGESLTPEVKGDLQNIRELLMRCRGLVADIGTRPNDPGRNA